MKEKRSIRLKEVGASVRRLNFPPQQYLVGRTGLSTGYGYTFLTDDDGLALTALPAALDDRDIFLVGGSSIEASYCDINKRASFLLQEKLLSVGVGNVCYNMGASGCTSLNLFNSIVNKLIGRTGDVIYFIPSNDVRAFEFKKGYINRSKYFANVIPAKNELGDSRLFDQNKQQLLSMLSMLEFFCKEFGFRFFVSGVIHRDEDLRYQQLNEMAEKFCRDRGIDFIKIGNYPKESFYDSVHLTAIGNEYISDALVGFLLNKNKNKSTSLINKNKVYVDAWVRFGLEETREISLFVDVESTGDVLGSSMLVNFNFLDNEQPDSKRLYSAGLSFSKIIGCYKYLELPEKGKRCVMQYTFVFPDGISSVGVTLKKWNSAKDFIIHNAVAYARCNGAA